MPKEGSTIRQAGGVVFRPGVRETEFLVVTTRSDRRTWIFPKGHVEDGETDLDAALREVEEEAGVRGAAVATLDPLHRYRSNGDDVVVRYVLVRALSDGKPEDGRDKRWVGADEALALLTTEESRRLLLAARTLAEPPRAGGDLLLAEHRHLSRSVLAIEHHAELRVLALVGVAAVAGLIGGVVAPVAALGVGLAVVARAIWERRILGHLRSELDRVRGELTVGGPR